MLGIYDLQKFCHSLRYTFDTAELIIAGGAVRDTLSGVDVKDVDVFVKLDDTPDEGEDSKFALHCKRVANIYGGEIEFRPACPEYGDILDLCDIKGSSIHPLVQIVGIYESPVDDVQRYDFGLSQSFVTPTGVYHTEAAMLDRAARTITYNPTARDDAAFKRSAARLLRLRAKYADWTFRGCEKLDEFNNAPVIAHVL